MKLKLHNIITTEETHFQINKTDTEFNLKEKPEKSKINIQKQGKKMIRRRTKYQ